MNELRKYATFSIDLTAQPVKINSMFSIGRARIFYKGINRNRSIIEGEVADKLASSIPGTPIVGLYNYETEDFEGHGEGQSAYGFVPLDPHSQWVEIDENGIKRNYLEVDVVIWDGRFEEARNILSEQKSLSMELNPVTLKGTMESINDKIYYRITNAEFAGITVLGEDVEPCFKDAGFLQAYSNMVSAYAKYMSNIQENEEGGISQMENEEVIVEEEVINEETEVETAEEEITEEVVEETATEEIAVEETTEETVEETTEFENVDEVEAVEEVAEETEATEETVEEEIVNEEPTEEIPSEEAPAEEEYAANEDEEEICPECGENPCICKNACGDEDKKYSLEEELAEYKAKNESLQNELNAALEALNKYTKQEKLEIIAKFSTKLESREELIADLTERVDELSKEEIKSELGNALVEQIEAEEETEEDNNNFSLNYETKPEVASSAWDYVKRHLENR